MVTSLIDFDLAAYDVVEQQLEALQEKRLKFLRDALPVGGVILFVHNDYLQEGEILRPVYGPADDRLFVKNTNTGTERFIYIWQIEAAYRNR